jgi:hypothetical protein
VLGNVIFALVAVWKDFLWPLLVEYGYNPSRETLNVGIFEAARTTPQNLVLAAAHRRAAGQRPAGQQPAAARHRGLAPRGPGGQLRPSGGGVASGRRPP